MSTVTTPIMTSPAFSLSISTEDQAFSQSPTPSLINQSTTTMHPETSTLSQQAAFELLVKFNDEKATLYVPVIVYMAVLTVVGTLGNILVCCVYCCKPTKTSSHFFILSLAVLDLLTCLIGMPTEIMDLRFPYMFYASAACKLLRFIESVTTIGSSIILISVAVDRYLRICKLGKQLSVSTAKRICVGAMIGGVLLSWPACLIFGKSTTELPYGLEGVDCSTDDSVRKTHYPSIYYGFLGLLFIGCLIFFSIIYCQIGLQIWRQKRAKIGEKSNRDSVFSSKGRTFSNSSTRETHSSEVTTDPPPDHGSDPISIDEMSSDQINENYSKKKCIKDRRISSISTYGSKHRTPKKRAIKVTRTTIVLFAVTVAYIVSYLPFLVLMVVRSVRKDFEKNLNSTEEVFFKLGVKSYFINNAINPLIYSFLNINFRKDAKTLLVRIMSCCCFCRRSTEV